jgi:putrescine aminotransferase
MESRPDGLLSISDSENLSIEQVWNLYRQHISKSQVSLIGSFGFGRELVDRAEGCYIYTRSGRKLLDLTGGIGVLNHGHNNPRILEARRLFAERHRMEVHKNFLSPYVAALAHNVASLLPGDLNYSYFPNSGAEAVEGAVKLAFKYHEGSRSKILHSDISFHGKLLGAAGLTGSPELHFKFPTIDGSVAFTYSDLDSFSKLVQECRKPDGSSDVYAVIVEPLNASTMRHCSPEFLLGMRKICNEEKIVLIFDEVYTGWGKTGHLFNFMRCDGLIPDVVTYAKSFGGGKASISGYTCRDFVYEKAYDNLRDATLHSTTYFGFGEETITAIESILTIVDEDLVGRARWIGHEFESRIRDSQLVSSFELRGSGALWGIVPEENWVHHLIERLAKLLPGQFFRDPQVANKLILGAIINNLYEEHKIVTYYGSNLENPLIISFPLISGKEEIELAVRGLTECFSDSLVGKLTAFLMSRFRKT